MPLAVFKGQPVLQMPQDLYIPPDALEVILEAFEGPLDLLLYLIRRQNLDILDIPVAEITRQYVDYIDVMQDLRFELAAEYLVMAAILAEIKSRMLLPRADARGRHRGRPARRAGAPPAGVRALQEGGRGHRRAAAPGARHQPGRGLRAGARDGAGAAAGGPARNAAGAARRAASAPTCSPTTRSPARRCRCASAWAKCSARLADGSFHAVREPVQRRGRPRSASWSPSCRCWSWPRNNCWRSCRKKAVGPPDPRLPRADAVQWPAPIYVKSLAAIGRRRGQRPSA